MSDYAGSVDITPGVSILGVLSHLNYEPWYALAEYVDNAIQSAHDEAEAIGSVEPDYHLAVSIDIDTDGPGRISIEDNAGGIRRQDFARAFRAADVPPDRSGLSEFGMGMKSASIWFARRWSVETTSVGDTNVYTVAFDMTAVLEGQTSELMVTTEPVSAAAHFTRITLWDLNQVPRGRTLGKIRDHMRDIYRNFLRTGDLRLVVSGERMSYTEPAILLATDARAEDGKINGEPAEVVLWKKDVSITLPDGVRVMGFAALREEGSTREAGFALFRRGRVILGSGDVPYRPAAIYGRGNSYRSQRLFGELQVEGLPVSHTKDGFQWGDHEEELLELLRQQLDSEPLPLLKQAENYRSRAVTRQQAKLIVDATESTARSVARSLPTVLAAVTSEDDVTGAATESDANSEGDVLYDEEVESSAAVERFVEFELNGQNWEVTVRSVQDSQSHRWLTRHIEKDGGGPIRIELALNARHPFIQQFALGDRDSFEAVLRIAVALVVSESLTRDAGLEFAGTMMRNVDTVLSRALSTRIGSAI
ncbi:ATP-binding protein [Leifsonia sp. NPDC056824]|uniref:ATP-binding protein n=1 Tax=Leifsonia sp. NPDC056824 TaxID=3345953 RepID=UPI003685A4A3